MHYEDGRHGNEDGHHGDEDGLHAGKEGNLLWDIQDCGNICLLQAILREFGFSKMLGYSAFR